MVRTLHCKIYNDGSHYIATRIMKSRGKSHKIDKPESKYFEEAYKKSFEEKIEPKNKPEYIKKSVARTTPWNRKSRAICWWKVGNQSTQLLPKD